MNRPRFETYAQEYLAPVLRPGDIVLVDRLKPHLYPEVRAAIEATGADYHPLPPYSPDFSPVEECGSKIKQTLRTAGQRTVVGVLDAMDRALHQVMPKDAEGWFRHAGYLDRPLVPDRSAGARLGAVRRGVARLASVALGIRQRPARGARSVPNPIANRSRNIVKTWIQVKRDPAGVGLFDLTITDRPCVAREHDDAVDNVR